MSGIYQRALTATAVLWCDVLSCDQKWESEPYSNAEDYRAEIEQVAPALALGWRVFAGQRSQHTYCPDHGPKTPMRLLHGEDR